MLFWPVSPSLPPPYREQVAARLVSLRDCLLLFFFIELGAALDMSTLGAQVGAASVFSLFVLIGNPLAPYLSIFERKVAHRELDSPLENEEMSIFC